MFSGMSGTLTWASDLPLFLNVVNGSLVLHAEDVGILRVCIATYINAARHFKQAFASSGLVLVVNSKFI